VISGVARISKWGGLQFSYNSDTFIRGKNIRGVVTPLAVTDVLSKHVMAIPTLEEATTPMTDMHDIICKNKITTKTH